jgi:hypothetical protein
MISMRRGPSVDGNDESRVSKEEVTCGAASDERRSTRAARGRGGAQAASMLRHRRERR